MTKKITLATLKSFIKKNQGKLYIRVRGEFDGMVDGISWNQKNFRAAQASHEFEKQNLGIKGVWIVGSTRNHFESYEDENFTGISVSNCCAYFTVAIQK